MKQFKLNIRRLLLNQIEWNKGNNCCFTDCIWMDLIQTWLYNIYYCTLHLDTSLIDLDFDSRSNGCEKANTSMPIISQSFQSIWMEFSIGLLLRLVDVMNLILILSRPFSIQGSEPYLCDFSLKKTNKHCLVFRHLETDFQALNFISVWITLTFIQGHSCMRYQKHWFPFSR